MHFGDTAFGQLVRTLSRGKLFAHRECDQELRPNWLEDLNPGVEQHDARSAPEWTKWTARWAKHSLATSSPSSQTSDVDSEKSSDSLVDWYGDQDPDNPQNWSWSEKAFVAGLICLYTFTVYLGSSIYTPSVMGVMQQFKVSYAAANLGLALFVFGYGAGAMLFSPLSEIPSIGRNWIYIITFVLYTAFTIGTAVAPNFGSLIILRFLAGFVGSPALATGGATLQDMYSVMNLPYVIAIWVAAASMGPALGPVMAGFAVEAKTWRWPMWIQVWLCGPVLVAMFLCMPETSASNILVRRARRLRKVTQCSDLRCEAETAKSKLTLRMVVTDALIRPIQISILDPGTGFMNAYVSLVYAIYYSFFESFPLIYPVIYRFHLGTAGLTFLSVVVTTAIGASCYIFYVRCYVEPQIRKSGELPPLESRLIPAIPASIMMPLGLFLFAWTSRESIHWIVGLIGIGIYSIGFYVLLQCVLLYVPQVYPKYAASLLAANDFCRSSLAAGFVMVGRPLFKNLGIGKGVSLLAALACLCVPLLVLLYRYGAWLRAKSRFASPPAEVKVSGKINGSA
ncbi:probable FLR1 - Putative H+ antiporter involved in multidrug resistance [Ustilago trichophora]|uniref:Probable FLR1 - Putative H+ antiporter involved in multidrug resistance n=1 Tax=Ustilago trichophora TaxID=86804 RepID=A0A5C3EEU9_9BASI|nr:probable FLR1 - Putative H+ antiporter involved in multidrug resistance [Ustilago trichophora]